MFNLDVMICFNIEWAISISILYPKVILFTAPSNFNTALGNKDKTIRYSFSCSQHLDL